jgi:preprotein translocase subunit Sss1
MISLSGLVGLVIYLMVAGLIAWLLLFLVDYINPPEPFKKVAKVAIVVIGVMVVIGVLLQLIGNQPVFVR